MTRSKHILDFLTPCFLAAAVTGRMQAATLVVTNTADSGPGSLRQLITSAAPGDTLNFAANLSGSTILLSSGQLSLANNLTIDGSALRPGIQINGDGISRIFSVAGGVNVVLTSLTITNGNDTTHAGGGGIFNSGNLTINQCTLAGNNANNVSANGGGGGIFNNGTLTVNQSTLTGNRSNNDSLGCGGGGIYNKGTLAVNQSTISGNNSDFDSSGGGGGGIFNSMTLNVFNSIVAGNSAVGNSSGDILSLDTFSVSGANIVQSFNGTLNGPAPINFSPQLVSLGNYTGPTPTMPPLPSSPAINACSVGASTNDQRGAQRLIGLSDIGSVELDPPTVATLPATAVVNSNATLNATLNPNTLATTAWFEWGVTNNPYHSETTPVAIGGGGTALAFSNNLTGLTPGVVYHYRVTATNVDGITHGNDVLFGSAPVVTLFGAAAMTNECHTVFTDPGATNAAGLPVTVTGNLNPNSPGVYLLTYTATNSLGGTGTTNRTVTVVDTTGPVITINGANPFYVAVNIPFVDPGATALDACGGSFAVVTNGTVNTAVLGSYPVTYSSTDSYGNQSTAIRTVVIRPRQIVTTTNSSGPGSLRQIISNSVSGDYIEFAANLSGTIIFDRGLTLSNNLTIDASALPGGVQINGSRLSRLFNVASNATVVMLALTITNGYDATSGGAGIYNSGTLTLNQCSVSGNAAVDPTYSSGAPGGGIYSSGVLTLDQCTMAGNIGYLGGGIYSTGILMVSQCTLTGNGALLGGGGGGIYSRGMMTVSQCTLTANGTAIGGGGGGIYTFGGTPSVVDQCTLTGNVSGAEGGGICNFGTLTVSRCTLARNRGESGGGGLYSAGTLTVNQCTITGNIADGQSGGGIFCPVAVTVIQSTITGNTAQTGGGIFDSVGTLINSIVSGNFAPAAFDGPDIYGNFTEVEGVNLVQSAFGGFDGPAPITNAPLLAVLGNYGGPTQTMPLLPGSPGVDGCTNGTSFTNSGVIFTLSTNDQRGFPRVLGLAPDLGAVEGIYNPSGPGLLTGMTRLDNGSTRFTFTNYTDTSFTVLASTNVALPTSTWTNLGPAVELPVGSGHFQFTDPQATNTPQRFYRVRAP